MNRMLALTIFSLLLITAATTLADVPALLPVQGFLGDADGVPIDNNNVTLQFGLFDSQSASEALWTETQLGVDVDKGVFSVYLGTETAIDPILWIDAPELWLEMSVGADVLGRIQVATVPFAFEAERCSQVGDLAESSIQKAVTGTCDDENSIRAINRDGTVECSSHQPSGALRHYNSVYQGTDTPLTLFCIDIPGQGMLNATVDISMHRHYESVFRAGTSKYHLYFAREDTGEVIIESVTKLADFTKQINVDLSKEILSFTRNGDRYTFKIDRSATMSALKMVHTILVDGSGYNIENFSFACD